MRYEVVSFYASDFFERFGFKWNFFYTANDLNQLFYSKFDYSIIKSYPIGLLDSCFTKEIIYLWNEYDKSSFYKIYSNNLEIQDCNEEEIFFFSSDKYSIKKKNNSFKIFPFRNNEIEIEYFFSEEFISRFLPLGILEYYNQTKTNNWLRLIDPATGNEKWKINYPYEIGRVQECNDIIILNYAEYSGIRVDDGYEGEIDWGNPLRYNIALNSETGKEVWKILRPRHGIDHNIDKTRGTFLCMQSNFYNKQYGVIESANVLEIDIKTGNRLLDIEVKPLDAMGFIPHFADEEAVYYTNHYGSFGKIRRNDGLVEWEFDLVDEKKGKRKVLNWLKLGNGKFVLQTHPNHKNGDLTCIFDPLLNLEEASVRDGVRIKDVLKK